MTQTLTVLFTPRGDKVTKSFLPHGVSSKAQLTDMISSINHLGAHIIGLDAAVKHVADTVKDQSTTVCASISSLQESQTAISQRLSALEVNQASILENQSVIINLLCEVASANGINTDDVPKGENEDKKRSGDEEKKKRKVTEMGSERKVNERGSEVTERGSDQAKKKASKDKCKRNVEDAKKDGSDDDGDDQPLSKRVRLAGYRRASIIPAAAISKSNVKSPSEGSGKGKNFHKIESIADQSLRLRMEIVKELDSGVDIDLKGIGFIETTKTSKRSKTAAKSSSRKIVSEVSPKENIKDSGLETKADKLFFFKEQSLVKNSRI